jgi:hypothetical protein
MWFTNEAVWDRVVRILMGIVLLYAGWSLWSGTLGIVALVIGAVAFVTGLAGRCPVYALFQCSTKKIAA